MAAALEAAGLRPEVDMADDTVGEKIRRALTQKHPAVLVVGDRDVAAHTVGVRLRGADEERGIPLDESGAAARRTLPGAPLGRGGLGRRDGNPASGAGRGARPRRRGGGS